jgi:hypothetical protein
MATFSGSTTLQPEGRSPLSPSTAKRPPARPRSNPKAEARSPLWPPNDLQLDHAPTRRPKPALPFGRRRHPPTRPRSDPKAEACSRLWLSASTSPRGPHSPRGRVSPPRTQNALGLVSSAVSRSLRSQPAPPFGGVPPPVTLKWRANPTLLAYGVLKYAGSDDSPQAKIRQLL